MHRKRPLITLSLAAALLLPLGIAATGPTGAVASETAPLAAPSDRAILTVTGKITKTNEGDRAVFDLGMLDALPSREVTTRTPWFDAPQTFSGPLLSEVMRAAGAYGEPLMLEAVNSYRTSIPAVDYETYPIILATRINGKVLSVRDKGPLFVIYPFDLHEELYHELYFGRSIWQLTRIEAGAN